MRHYEEKEEQIVYAKRLHYTHTECDFCGKKNDAKEHAWPTSPTGAPFGRTDVTMWGAGVDSGIGRINVDICCSCFVKKLVPWIEKETGRPVGDGIHKTAQDQEE